MGGNFLKILLEAHDEKWKCFCCDPSQIDSFAEECSVIMKLLKRQKMKGYAFESKKTHLGGPSQFERKERLKNISHVLEDKVTGPGDVVKVEIDPDLDLPAQELLKYDIGDEDGRVSSKTKRKVPAENVVSSEHLAKDDEMLSMSKLSKLHKTGENKGDYLLKECKVILERVDIPVNCIMPIVSHDRPKVASEREIEKISLISDSDIEPDVGTSGKATKEGDNMLSKDRKKVRFGKCFANVDGTTPEVNDVDMDSDEDGSELQSDEGDESYDIEETSDFEIKEELQDLPALEDSEESLTNQESSDSDYDYQRFRRKSIRRNMHDEKGKVFENLEKENFDNNEGVSGGSINADDDDGKEERKPNSSDESMLLKRKGKRRKETKKNVRQRTQSESDSDAVSRMKKRPRRKRRDSSNSSGSSIEVKTTDESEEEDYRKDGRKNRKKQGKGKKLRGKGKTRGKKRKNKVLMTDSNESSDDEKSPSKNKGRKNIRRILGEEELGEETRKARHLEEERRRRLLERTQATYIEEQARRKSDMAGRTILEMDKKEGVPLVEVHDSLVSNLKPHQVEGIQFMYDCLFESVEKFKNGDKGNGALLAHCMGLGKSLQVCEIRLHVLTI